MKEVRKTSENVLLEGIDLIVGGKSCAVLNPPLWIEDRSTAIVQAGVRGQCIGVIRLRIDSQGTVVGHEGEVVFLGPGFADDPEMRAFLDRYK